MAWHNNTVQNMFAFILCCCFYTSHVAFASTSLRSSMDKEKKEAGGSYVFLQKFPLENSGDMLFHTEVLVCPKDSFSLEDQEFLNEQVADLKDFVKIEESWWSGEGDEAKARGSVKCVEMGYGGASCHDRCCAVPHGPKEVDYAFSERRAVIQNAVTKEKSLYLYGSSASLDGEAAYKSLCSKRCWSNWAGTDYNVMNNNCNTFTSAVLHCIFGLSEKKPSLGMSDLVTVTCDKCTDDEEFEEESMIA